MGHDERVVTFETVLLRQPLRILFSTRRKEIPVLSAELLSVVHSVYSVKKKVESAEF